ncbi:MAG: hypothetical protein HY540_05220 [Deltaproteobacteria bacterium]|nr:hypothetical protein [Deltaproteobacteria bacterium]
MKKVRKQFILDPVKIRRARKILGVSTDTDAVNGALDLLLGNAEIVQFHQQFFECIQLKDMDQSKFRE